MMKKITILIFQALICFTAVSQNGLEQILNEIEKNNTHLQAIRAQHDAMQLAHKTGIYLSDPQFEYAWFAGSPSTIGSKTNLSVMQHFHFPSAYRHMGRIANARNEQLAVEYNKYRKDLRFEATLTCLQIIHANAMAMELDKRRSHAAQLADGYKKMLDLGETNLIEYNKARLNLLNIEKEYENTLIRQQKLLGELTALNGGTPLELPDTAFPGIDLPVAFDQWYEQIQRKNPVLQWLDQEVEISRKEQQLQRAMNLPGFHTGYVSEMLTHEQFRGFAVGLSIPLWENKNRLKLSRAHTLAIESEQYNQQTLWHNEMRSAWEQATALLSTTNEYNTLLGDIDNTALLAQAWQQGEINLTHYLLELSFFYQGINQKLEMELELHTAIAKLMKYTN